jgi:two-component system response regulator AtoC
VIKILIVDDEVNIRKSLAQYLQSPDRCIVTASDGLEAKTLLLEEHISLVVSDLRMPGMDGIQLLTWCKNHGPDIPFLIISAHGELRDAVEAMRQGACDYVTKPFDPDELELRINQALEISNSRKEKKQRRSVPVSLASGAELRVSPAWQKIKILLEKIAPAGSLVLISGESGTGKEVLAQRIHAASKQSQGSFVAVNIAAVPENLLESELFGHEKGAFTGADKRKTGMFELASGGTLFLDEIGDMPLQLQVKLLRVLQERKIQRLGATVQIPIDARIVAASNRNLAQGVKDGWFREDLFYRLHVVPVHLPSLRERKEDLPWLCDELLFKHCLKMGRSVPRITESALAKLSTYDFPGNIRELENILERALIFLDSDAGVLECEDLDLSFAVGTVEQATITDDPTLSLVQKVPEPLVLVERNAIRNALDYFTGNQTKAAEALGISRRTLFSKIREYGL